MSKVLELINTNLSMAFENMVLSKKCTKKFKGEKAWEEMIESDRKTIQVLTELKKKYTKLNFDK
jgi:AAA+ ATPase superfamily predicted ATPase